MRKWLWLVLIGACSSSPTPEEAVPDVVADVAEDVPVPQPEVHLGPPCHRTDECPTGWCDKRYEACVECYASAHCPNDEVCMSGDCVPTAPCTEAAPCQKGHCGPDGVCVDCLVDTDCAPGNDCVASVCRKDAQPCAAAGECDAIGGICLIDQKGCRDCLFDKHCSPGEKCKDYACLPAPCPPDQASCTADGDVEICRGDGLGSWKIPCPEGQLCIGGACTDADCLPGTTSCVQHQVKKCLPNHTAAVVPCPPAQECREGACHPMRQRVLVVFDTSGSMNWIAGTNTPLKMCGGDVGGACLKPWPACEVEQDPKVTTLGKFKSAFGKLFSVEDIDAVFGLSRFPQVSDRSTPICEGGYEQGSTEIDGDEGEHTIADDPNTWFDRGLSEVLLVPFPPSVAQNNLPALGEWVDFTETIAKTDTPCEDGEDCPDHLCLGPANKKTCRQRVNPELRADGWTPLGKSLFYAGEYLRRYVVVDGHPCSTDADCGSAGYYCNLDGRCFDPLKSCRLNVIVLFTDGQETEYQNHTEYFNPVVQAKRMRYGLGCAQDADCSDLVTCSMATGDKVCHQAHCDPKGYCTHDGIEADVHEPKVAYRETAAGGVLAEENRLRDLNGDPIEVVVNVVDASNSDPTIVNGPSENRLIALYGGGLYVLADLQDEANFLLSLKTVVDPKSLFAKCKVTP